MNNDDGAINFRIGLDNSQLQADAARANAQLRGIGNTATVEGSRMGNAFNQASGYIGMAAMAGVASIGLLGREILNTTAKFEKFGIVLRNALGEAKGTEALSMLSNFAATTPFQLDEVTGAFIKMANQGFVPTQNEMVKLGDLASSTGKSFDQLGEALLDAQTGEFERLKEFGIKASANGDKVTFSFKEQKTTVENTNSAIQGYILSLGEMKGVAGANALISASLTGQLSNLGDKLAFMYNQIGNSNKGILYAAVGGASTLIENYAAVGEALTVLIGIYGIQKVAVMAVAYAENLKTAATARAAAVEAEYTAIVSASNFGMAYRVQGITAEVALQNARTLAIQRVAAAETELAATQKTSSLANPYVLAAMAVAALGYAIYKVVTYQTDLEKAIKKTDIAISNEKDKAAELFAELNNAAKETDAWKQAKEGIIAQYGSYLPEQLKELKNAQDIAAAYELINAGITKNVALKSKNETISGVREKYTPGIVDAQSNIFDGVYNKSGTKAYTMKLELASLIEGYKNGTKTDSDFDALRNKAMALTGSVNAKGQATGFAAANMAGYFSDLRASLSSMNTELEEARKGFNQYDIAEAEAKAKAIEQLNNRKTTLEKEISDLKKVKNGDSDKEIASKQAEIDSINSQLGNKAAVLTTYEKQQEELRKKKAKLEKELEVLKVTPGVDPRKAIVAKQGEIDAIDKQLGYKKGDSEKLNKAQEDRNKASEELERKHLENLEAFANWESGISAGKISNMKSGLEKEKAQNALAYETRIKAIDKEREATLKSLNDKAGIKEGSKNEIKSLAPGSDEWKDDAAKRGMATTDFNSANEKSTSDSAIKIAAIWRDVNDAVLTGYQKEIAANADKFDKMAKEAGDNKDLQIAIAKQRAEGEKAITSKFSLSDFQEKIDWETVFGDLDSVSTSVLNELRGKLKEYLASVGNTISKTDLKTVTTALKDLNDKIADRTPIKELTDGYKEYKTACDEVSKAQKALNDLTENGKGSTKDLKIATDNLTKAEAGRMSSLKKMSTAANSIGKDGKELVGAANDVMNTLTNLGINIGDEVKGAISGLGQMFDGLSSLDLTKPMSIVTGAVKIVTGTIDAVASIFTGGSKEVSQGVIDNYNNLMSVIKDVITAHKALMTELSGEAAVSESDKMVGLISKQIEATRKLGLEYLASSAKHSHSYGHQLQVAMSEFSQDLAKIGVDFSDSKGGIGQLFTMSPEQLTQIKETIPEAWAKIDDKTRAYLQTIIDSNGELDDAAKALGEALTDLSFDSAKSALKDLFLSTDTTLADISGNFEKYMKDAIVNSLMDTTLAPLIQKWYEDFTAAMSDGLLSGKEKTDLQAEYANIGKIGLEARDAAYSAAGISNTASQSNNSMQGRISAAITEDTATELVGLWNRTALDIRETLNMSKASSNHLLNIAANTLRTADNTDRLAAMESSLKNIETATNKTASRL